MTPKLKIELYQSVIGRPEKQRRIVSSLGLKKMRRVREVPDVVTVRGAINKVSHLVRIVE